MVMRTVQSEQRCCPAVLTSQAISAHFLWLSFLQEQWAVIGKLRDARTAAARVMYGRLLAASLHDPAVLSHHPAAVGAYFRLLTLGLKYGRSCLRAGPATAGKDVLLLFDRILQAVRHKPYDYEAVEVAWCMEADLCQGVETLPVVISFLVKQSIFVQQ
jgi:transposase